MINIVNSERYAQSIFKRTKGGDSEADWATSCGAIVCLLLLNDSKNSNDADYDAIDRATNFITL
jgi:hypothetical protein